LLVSLFVLGAGMKKCHLYEVTLVDGKVYCGEILSKNGKVLWLKLKSSEKIRINNEAVMVMKDLGWQKVYKK